MITEILRNNITNSKSMLSLSKVLIENGSFQSVNVLINSCVYNLVNISSFNRERNMFLNSNRKSFMFFVEGNGYGHVTQMFEIYNILKDTYLCTGIIIGHEKEEVNQFGKKNNIPILNLKEPDFIHKSDNTTELTRDILNFLFDYSVKDYKRVSSFIFENRPNFYINLHLPLKIPISIREPIFNISTQNRIDYKNKLQDFEKYGKYDKYTTNCVLLSSYLVHNSYNDIVKIAIDAEQSSSNQNSFTIPPLITIPPLKFDLCEKESNIIVCYFNIVIPIEYIQIFEELSDYEFHIFGKVPSANNLVKNPASNIFIYDCKNDNKSMFHELRLKCKYFIGSCGVETIYENFMMGISMLCVPSNSEQLFNAIDHEKKILGFFWSFEITKSNIEKLFEFEYDENYWKSHKTFMDWFSKKDILLRHIIQEKMKY